MSSTPRRANYCREETPSGVWLLFNLDEPDSPVHIVGPADRSDWDDVHFVEVGSMENYNENVDEAGSRGNNGEDGDEAGTRETFNDDIDEGGSREIDNQEVLNGMSAASEVVEASVRYPTEVFYYPITGGAPIPAVYHHDLREELIRTADLKGKYSYKQPRGEDFTDVTSFLEEQREWGTQRANYPWIVFEYQRLDRRDPDYEIERWYHHGRIVLDCEGIPLKKLLNIPAVLSAEYPGCFMEANRRQDSRIKDRDFAARMPPISAGTNHNNDGQPILKFPKSANTLSCRRRRFRQKAGCLTWGPKPCPGMEKFLEDHLPQEFKDRNTTYGFRDLTVDETTMVRASGKDF